MKQPTIAVLSGDGIGPEVMTQALRVLAAATADLDGKFLVREGLIGGAAFESCGRHFPDETASLCAQSDAILMGSVGGGVEAWHLPKWKDCEVRSLLALRKTLHCTANLRPARVYPSLTSLSPLKERLLGNGVDLMIVRELSGGLYYGAHQQFHRANLRCATDLLEYNERQIQAVAVQAFEMARQRRKHLVSVDKANVLASSQLWRAVVNEISQQYPEVRLQHMLVDNCAMQLVLNPSQFDVIVTSNLFGDVLSDAAAALPGSLGLMPSASLNSQGKGLYEPAGGSAPHLAGKNKANPIAQILSLAMMFRYSFAMNTVADRIERAIVRTLEAGYRTEDIATRGESCVGTEEMTTAIIRFFDDNSKEGELKQNKKVL